MPRLPHSFWSVREKPVVVLTGPSGAGKSTLLAKLTSQFPNDFARVEAVTTRAPRADDSGQYRYLSNVEFEQLQVRGTLITSDRYDQNLYGVERDKFFEVLDSDRIPVLTLTSHSVDAFRRVMESERPDVIITSFFMNASDEVLFERSSRSAQSVEKQKMLADYDRKFGPSQDYHLDGPSVEASAALVTQMLLLSSLGGGILNYRHINTALNCGVLLRGSTPSSVQGASYDLRLGDEYFYGGKILRLKKSRPILLIEPYDYAIVTALEKANLPSDVAGRFDLSVSLFSQGLILSNGPQVDPGFRGNLFCLLFNTSSSPVMLKRGEHFATIEFERLLEQTRPYRGKKQDRTQIVDYLPPNASVGAINQLKREVEGAEAEFSNSAE